MNYLRQRRDKLGRFSQSITNTWTWNHLREIAILSLIVVAMIQTFGLPSFIPEAEVIAYESAAPATLADALETRAYEIFEERKEINLERARIEAIQEYREQLLIELDESPFVDYEEVREVVKNAYE